MTDDCKECADLRERVTRTEEKVKQLQRLMKSCLVFQRTGSTFITRYNAEEAAKKRLDARRSKIHFALLSSAIALLAADKHSVFVEAFKAIAHLFTQ